MFFRATVLALNTFSVIDPCNTSGRNTMYADLPPSPDFSTDNSELALSRGVSFTTDKTSGKRSEKSRYHHRLDLMDRMGASNLPGERSEQPTPISNAGDDTFVMDDQALMMDNNDNSPFMKDPLSIFDDDGDADVDDDDKEEGHDDDVLCRETSNLTNQMASKTPGAKTPFESMRLKERTSTDLSQVGPLPTFMARDNTTRNFDDVSTDSAFDSAVSYSEYAASHFSEKMTMSHADQQSSKHSQVSEENNMFDVELVSTLEYEGDSDLAIDVNSNPDIDTDSVTSLDAGTLNRMKGLDTKFNLRLDTINSSRMSSVKIEEQLETGRISVTVTPRSSTFTNTPRALPSITPVVLMSDTPRGVSAARPSEVDLETHTHKALTLTSTTPGYLATKPPLPPGIQPHIGIKFLCWWRWWIRQPVFFSAYNFVVFCVAFQLLTFARIGSQLLKIC